NFTRPSGTYSMLLKGCTDTEQNPLDTQWWAVNWDADVPPNTSLLVHARAGASSDLGDPSWRSASWTPDGEVSPFVVQGTLVPNLTPENPNDTVNDSWLQVEFVLKTTAQNASPKLKSFQVAFKCAIPPG